MQSAMEVLCYFLPIILYKQFWRQTLSSQAYYLETYE